MNMHVDFERNNIDVQNGRNCSTYTFLCRCVFIAASKVYDHDTEIDMDACK